MDINKQQQLINTPTTDAQIRQYFPDINIIQYSDLAKYSNFNELCNNPYNACFILYVNKMGNNYQSGHWNMLMCNDNKLNLFDSYGDFFNDYNLILIGKNRKNYGENEPLLSNLILNDPSINEIHYNNKPYQQKNGSSTCGRHCIYRLMKRDLNNMQYNRHMNSLKKKMNKANYDELIVNLINK
jgi:hypothetical protein